MCKISDGILQCQVRQLSRMSEPPTLSYFRIASTASPPFKARDEYHFLIPLGFHFVRTRPNTFTILSPIAILAHKGLPEGEYDLKGDDAIAIVGKKECCQIIFRFCALSSGQRVVGVPKWLLTFNFVEGHVSPLI